MKSKRCKLLKRTISTLLLLLHLITFTPIRDALAFTAQSQSYRLSAGALNEGGRGMANLSARLWQDSLGESAIGRASSASYSLNSGLMAILQTNPPTLTQHIPYQSWLMDSAKANAFDLDDYFSSDTGALSYTVSGNSQITVSIDPATHIVSFSQPGGFSGVEEVYFTTTDTEGNSTQSNKVTLQVENPQGQDRPVIVEVLVTPQTIQEGDLVKLIVKAKDLDNDVITFSYNQLFAQTNTYQLNGYWYSEVTWQTSTNSKGHYPITITAKDTNNLSDIETLTLNVGNFNHLPQLLPLSPITTSEGDLVVINPQATDPDNDALSFYYAYPFDSTGKWLTDYEDEGAYSIKVTASDGIDTVFQDAKITILKTNRAPQVNLILSKYTVLPNGEITITLSATDPDGDALSFSLKKDGTEIASGSLSAGYTATTSFSRLGDHTISATVTDSGGLTATDTVNVDVVDPQTNKEAINPVMGDFNGDSLLDLGLHNSDSGTWEVAISDKGSFTAALDWLSNFGTSKEWIPIGGDFNGDAKTDIGIYNGSTGELKIATSTGSGFGVQGTWQTVSFASSSWQLFTGNYNADKYTDIALYNRDTGEVRVALGTGSGFGSFNTWLSNSSDTGYIAMSGDFNADSLSDLCLFQKTSGEFKVVFSNSQGFVDELSWISGYATDKDPLLSDFNNDGLTDIGYWDKVSSTWDYAISTGAEFRRQGTWLSSFGQSSDDSATTGDFDGNGITDAATFDRDKLGIDRWTTKLNNTTKPADLLTEIDNGISGKTQISYTYAAGSDNPELPFPIYVASEIKLRGTLPLDQAQESYTQSFSFSGGYYDAAEREFRGFQRVKVTDPITHNFSETYFYQGKPGQDGALKGQIEKVIAYDGNGKKISEALNTYEVRKSGPQTNVLGAPFLIEQTTAVWEENAATLTTKTKFSYDNIGNLLEERQEGDVLKTGDEKISQTTYTPAYEIGFNRPLEAALKDKDGNVVSQKSFEYDERGNLAKEEAWLYNSLTNTEDRIPITYSYDSFGNLISATNALEQAVTTDYEITFYTYPEKITNALEQSITYVYEPKFGAVKSVTDANGISSSTTYDSLGRVVRATKDDGRGTQVTAATYSYPDFNTKVSTNAIGFSSTEYLDGLGRKYKTISIGEDGPLPRKVSSETYFNNRGQVEKESLTHYINEDPAQISYLSYEYDIRGRLKKTISDFPGTAKDTESSINYINPLQIETINPKGQRKATKKDVYGNILEVIEYAATDGVFHTYYTYDLKGNLIQTKDNQDNITQIFYDSLGRKLKMIDPDMGTWSYEYDAIGSLRKQTDSKGQVLEFEYDSLNRLKKKSSLRGAAGDEAILSEYTYDDPTKPNCIGRLSKVTDQSGSTEFFYDNLGREIKSIKSLRGTVGDEAISYTVQREYDPLDRLTKLTYPDGEVVSYGYDSNSGLLETVTGSPPVNPLTGAQTYVSDISYNASGQIKTIAYGNNVQTAYSYGQDLRLSRILTSTSTSTLQNLNYDFDQNGNLSTLTDNLRSNIRTYLYDELDRLKEAQNLPSPTGGYTTFSYQYDSIGNMIYKSDLGVMTYGENTSEVAEGLLGGGNGLIRPHALTSAGGYTYSYDANGNMLLGKNKTLEYDVENRLTKVSESGRITSFTYDGDGGRVSKTVIANPPQAGEAISTTYLGSLFEIQSVDSSPKSVVKHIFAGAQRICSVTTDYGLSTTDYHYYHSDHLGSSNIITDQNGNQAQYCEYTPYGSLSTNVIATEAKQSPINHYFTGKELDQTGLYFYGARYYDPEIGRFISADTIVQAPYDPQSLNRYAYARNNPIKYTDPTGHSWKSFWKKFGSSVLSIVGIVAAPFTGGASLYLTWAGLAWSGVNAAQAGQFGAFAVGLGAGLLTAGLFSSFVAPAMAGFMGAGETLTAFQGAVITATEFGAAGAAAGFAGTLAGGGSLGQAGMAAGIGFGAGAVMGGAIGYTYAAGMQDVLHGFDTRGYNNTLQQYQKLYGNLSSAEKTFVRQHPIVSAKIMQESVKSLRFATQGAISGSIGGGIEGIHNGPADAVRHALWSGSSARRVGAPLAREFTSLHELTSASALETQMDTFNNNVGFALATDVAKDKTGMEQLVMDEYKGGRLQTGLGQ